MGRIIPARNTKHAEIAAPKANNQLRDQFFTTKKGCPKEF